MTVLGAFFLHPGLLLLGGVLAAIPLIIHLINRRRVRRIEWGAMQWLIAAMKRQQRRMRLEHLLMLLLRMGLIALLGMALARPILTDSSLAGLVGGKRSVYVLIDNSYSTEAKVDARSVFEHIQQSADTLLSGLGNDDALTVVVTNDPDPASDPGTRPFVLQPRTVGAEGAVRAKAAIATLHPRHAPAAWPAALELLRTQFAPEDQEREVIVLTDLQATDWQGRQAGTTARAEDGDAAPAAERSGAPLRRKIEDLLRAPAQVRLVNLGGSSRRNLAVEDIDVVGNREPLLGRPVRLSIAVTNYGTKAATGATLELRAGDEGLRRVVRLPVLPPVAEGLGTPRPGRVRTEVVLPPLAFDSPGAHIVEARVLPSAEDAGADTLGRDSTRWRVVEIRERVRVLGWARTSRTELTESADAYLRGVYEGSEGRGDAGSLLPWFYTYDSVRTEADLLARLQELGGDPIDLVVLANVAPRDPQLASALQRFVRGGGGLLCFVGDSDVLSDPAGLNDPFYETIEGERLLPYRYSAREARDRRESSTQSFALDLETREHSHPLATPFTGEDAKSWIKLFPPRIWGRMAFVVPEDEPEPGDSDVTPQAGAEVVLRYADGRAAIVANEVGAGRAVWVSTSIDNGWLGEDIFFRPVLLSVAAAWLTEGADAGRTLTVGGRLRARLARLAERVRLTVPGGRETALSVRDDANSGGDDEAPLLDYVYDELGVAGPWRLAYTIQSRDGAELTREEPYAVNVAAPEGMLIAADADALTAGLPEGLQLSVSEGLDQAAPEVEETRRGEISRVLLWIVLALLLVEPLIALFFGRGRMVAERDAAPGATA